MSRLMLVRKTLRDVRTATIAIGFTVFAMALLVVAIYPEYSSQLSDVELPEFFEGFLGESGEWTSPAGFFSAEFFSWVPLLLVTLAIIGATGTLAGEESAGTLDLLLAHPMSRTRLLLEKAAGLTLAMALAALVALPGFLIGLLLVEVDLSVINLTLAVLNMLPVSLLFLTFTLWASAALPSRGTAAVVAIAAVVLAYVLNMIGSAVDALSALRWGSPFYWADASRVLLHGIDPLRSGALLGLAALFLALAVWSFNQRDIAVGMWVLPFRIGRRRQGTVRQPAVTGQHGTARPRM